MRRRTTLGPVSSSQLNAQPPSSRVSLGPVRMGATDMLGKPGASFSHARPSATSKSSMRHSPSRGRSRHSSLRGDASTDPRPIKDKAFVNKNIRVLLNFLTDHNYDFPISPRILSRPAVRDFANIIQFLFRKIDPNFNSAGKFEDEVIQMFKALGYPFNISKTALVAVGSPHTWPTLLAAVMWVTELLTVDEELTDAEERAEVLSDDVNLNQKVFFGYLSRAYKHFMSGEDDRYAALEEQFAASFESKIQELTIELNEVLERNEELRKQTVDAQGRRSRLPQLRQERTDLEIELEKLQVLIEQLKNEKEQFLSTIENRTKEVEQLNSSIASVSSNVNDLRDQVARQEISAQDVERMLQEKKRLDDNLAQASEHRQHLQRKIWEREQETTQRMDELGQVARGYSELAEDLGLIPVTARNANGINYELCLNNYAFLSDSSATPSRVVQTNVSRDLLPVLSDLKKSMAEEALKLRKEVSHKSDDDDELEIQLEKADEESSALIVRIKRTTEQYKREKESHESVIREVSAEVTAVEEKLILVKNLDEDAQVLVANRRIAEHKTRLAAQKGEHENFKVAMYERVMEVAEKCIKHRQHIEKRLVAVRQRFQEELNRLLLTEKLGDLNTERRMKPSEDVSDIIAPEDSVIVSDLLEMDFEREQMCEISGVSSIPERAYVGRMDSRYAYDDSDVRGAAEAAMNLSRIVPEPRISAVLNLADAINRAAMEDSRMVQNEDEDHSAF